MHEERPALLSRMRLILVAASVLAALAAGVAVASPPGNFVSIFSNPTSSCSVDLHPSDGENDAAEEGAAGRAAEGLGSFAGIAPEGSTLGRCGQQWIP